MDDGKLESTPRGIDGQTREPRRRWGAGVAVLVGVLGVAAAVPFAWSALTDAGAPEGQNQRAVQGAGLWADGVSWAAGSEIHTGDASIDVGHDVHAFVVTSGGYVFVDQQGRVWSWQAGRVSREGTTFVEGHRTQLLVAEGARAAWLDTSTADWSYVVIEQLAGVPGLRAEMDADPDEVMRPGGSEAVVPGVRALIDGDLIANDMRGLIRMNFERGTAQTLLSGPTQVDVADAEEDQLLVTAYDESGLEATYLTEDVNELGEPLPIRGGDIAPEGAWVMSNSARESDGFLLFDVATGQTREPAVKDDFDFFSGVGWVSGGRYVVVGTDLDTSQQTEATRIVQFLVCDVATDTCRSAGKRHTGRFQLPNGVHRGG